MTELTLIIRSQFWLNCYEMLCYYVIVIYRQKPITRRSVVLLPYLSEELFNFIMGIQYIHVEYG